MEVKIGVLHTPRELSVDTEMSVEDVEAAVEAAVSSTKPSSLVVTDTKGRKVIVPANLVAYVEIAPADVRRVGFATG
ncbi:DUF3107 domain-containing protein [Jatrophihabitans sp. YIM 134969]